MFLIVYELTGSKLAAWVSGLTIAFSSTLWANATWAVSYDLNAFLTIINLYLLYRWIETRRMFLIYAFAFVFGLSLGNHRLILVVAPAAIYLFWNSRHTERERFRFQWFLLMALLFSIGFAVNLYLPIRAAQNPPYMWADASDPETLIKMIFAGSANPRAFVNPFENISRLRVWLATVSSFPIYELTVIGLLIAVFGGVLLYKDRRLFFNMTLFVVLLTGVMVSIYGIHNIFNYFIPLYLMMGIWLGYGCRFLILNAGLRLPPALDSRLSILRPKVRILLTTIFLLMIPFFLLARNFQRLDRSQNWQAYDFAKYLLSELEDSAIVLADFWSWAPLRYVQLVEGTGFEIAVLPALSDPRVDQPLFLKGLLDAGAPVYVAVSSEETPRLSIDHDQLQLVAPFVIQSMTTPRQPLPEYKDLLVPQGMVYQAKYPPPDPVVDRVPLDHRRTGEFDTELVLLGFHLESTTVTSGKAFKATYYWKVEEDTDIDYWVDILFTDGEGNVETKLGFPLWLHSHWVGGLNLPTSQWTPGLIYREKYDGLVPREIQPGAYQIRAVLYQGGIREGRVNAKVPGDEASGILLGVIYVEME
jgi:type III secretory pathway component EscS